MAANSSPAGPAPGGDLGAAHYPWPPLHNGVMDLVDYAGEAVVRAARRQKEAHP